MRRLLVIAAVACASVAALATGAAGDDSRTYYLEFDNAFGLTSGSEVRVAGVSAGTVTDFEINSDKRAVVEVEISGPLAVLGQQTVCRSEPQSLIAEYFIDCSPRGPPIEIPDEGEQERVEHPDIPVAQTRQTVQNDLVLNTFRTPFRDRLAILINEFGTGLAANGKSLNDAIRRGAPALEQTRKVTDLLAGQNKTIRDLNVHAERIISRLAERRHDVVRFIDEAKITAEAAAARRDDLSRDFALLDDFLAQLEPTMTKLDRFAVEGTPLAANLRAAAPGLTTLARNLPAFSRSATAGLQAFGNASVTGRRALRKGSGEIRQLAKSTKKAPATADDLSDLLRDVDDPGRAVEVDARAAADTGRKAPTGYTGLEGLLNYLYYQTLAINQFDEVGHMLHISIFEVATGPCAEYNAGTYEGGRGVPAADGSGATTDIRKAHRCVSWLGDRQPDINEPLHLPPYDPSVCPEGSTDLNLCNPAGATSAPAGSRPGGGGLGSDDAGGGERGASGVGGTGGGEGKPEGAAAGDLLDYLFGT